MLEINNINAFYGKIQILWDVSLKVNEGEIVALIPALSEEGSYRSFNAGLLLSIPVHTEDNIVAAQCWWRRSDRDPDVIDHSRTFDIKHRTAFTIGNTLKPISVSPGTVKTADPFTLHSIMDARQVQQGAFYPLPSENSCHTTHHKQQAN